MKAAFDSPEFQVVLAWRESCEKNNAKNRAKEQPEPQKKKAKKKKKS